jgi:HlyD family secretion protein
VWGLDGATAMLTIAERRRQEQRDLAPRLRFLQRLLPLAPVDPELPAAGFSALVSNSLLHHLHDPQALWSSLRPWAAPGALLFLRDLRRPTDAASLRALVKRHAAQAPPLLRRDYARSLRAAFTPAEVRQQLDQAQANFDRDKALLDNITRQIEVARLSGRREDIDAARFAVEGAQAALANAQARQARTRVFAQVAGRIEEVYYRQGEVAPQGRPVVSLLPPENVKVRFFVPQDALARVAINGVVFVSCDGCAPGLTGGVSFIAQQAEYTPPVIYSLEERSKLVYKIEARPDRPQFLRVGQPVTVELAP